jgi:hypothetical protein
MARRILKNIQDIDAVPIAGDYRRGFVEVFSGENPNDIPIPGEPKRVVAEKYHRRNGAPIEVV